MAFAGYKVLLLVDYNHEDMEVQYPKIRLEEEGFKVVVAGTHPAGTKYTGKYGYPVVSDVQIEDVNVSEFVGMVIPGGFAPDYMRRNAAMKEAIVSMLSEGQPVAAICHGPWMFCSSRKKNGRPVIDGAALLREAFSGSRQHRVPSGVDCTGFVAIKDDVENAGGVWKDEPVVIGHQPETMDPKFPLRKAGPIITSRTPADLGPFCKAIIAEIAATVDC